MGLLKKLGLVSYPIQNWEQGKKFYGETLGLPVAWFQGDEAGWIQYGDENGAQLALSLWRDAEKPCRENAVMAIFDVEDVAQAVSELRAKGVRCDDPVTIPQMVTYSNIYDPEGNRIQIVNEQPPA